MSIFTHPMRIIKGLPKFYFFVVVGVLVIGGVSSVYYFSKPIPSAAVSDSEAMHVMVASAASLAGTATPLPLIGTVTSLSQATVLAQASGQITALPHTLGDTVTAGTIIATFENASQQAAVLQAEGTYESAAAALARVTGSSNQNTTAATLAALQSGYAAIDDAVHIRADQLFSNPRTSSPNLVLIVPDSALVSKLEAERITLESTLSDMRTLSVTASTDTVAQTSQKAVADAQVVLAFLDDLLKAVNETPASQSMSAATLAGYQTSLSVARTEVVAVISGVTTAKSAYDANDASAAEAALKQAQGALDAAKANLEKTVVRSPISGTIVSLPISLGDSLSMNAPVAVISNPGALYVDAQVTPVDARTLLVGNRAVINGSVAGVVTFIALALDPATSKIEVKVGISGNSRDLTDGEVVSLSLTRTTHATLSTSSALTIPIVAIKILPTGPAVFTVATSSVLVEHPIQLGSILGDQVVVRSGLTPDMRIITDARGLAQGQTVIVDEGLTN